MRIEFGIALDIPDAETLSDDALREAIFESYVNYVAVQHLGDVVRWTASVGRYESAGDMQMLETARRLVNIHQTWGDIAAGAEILSVRRAETPPAEGEPTG